MSRSLVTLDDPCAAPATPPTTTNLTFFFVRPASIEVKLISKIFSRREGMRRSLRVAPVASRESDRATPVSGPGRSRSAWPRLPLHGRRLDLSYARADGASPATAPAKDWRGRWN